MSQDNFEIIRDQIAIILANEVVSQMALAAAATNPTKDPDDWKLRIFTERANPWEQFLNPDEPNFDPSPIVDVWYDTTVFDQSSSNIVQRQKGEGTFNIDCYGYGRSEDDGGTGHIPGDEKASKEAQRGIRLVRNIMMAADYTYLGLRGVVWQRWPQAITVFRPQLDARNVQNVVGARLALRVQYNEFSPQPVGTELEIVAVDVQRAEDGEIIAQAQYNYPITP